MEQLRWCAAQKNGIEVVAPNNNLRVAYLIKADEALDTLRTSRSRDWQLTAAYYAIYHSLYSLLMSIGIKCEIHTCTIAFAKNFLGAYLSAADISLIEQAFSARIDAQYYVNKKVPDDEYEMILKNTPAFLVTCKNILLTENEIDKIRKQVAALF